LQAVGKLTKGKAPGICGISGELLKYSGPAVVSWLTQIFKGIWATGHVAENWRKWIILPLYKDKGGVESIVFVHLLLDRVRQAAFCSMATRGRFYSKEIDSGSHSLAKSSVTRTICYKSDVNVLNSCGLPVLIYMLPLIQWTTLCSGCYSKALAYLEIDMFKDLYTNTMSCVRLDGELSDWFHFGSGVRQGCTVPPPS